MKSTGRLTAELLVKKGGASPAGSQNITQLKPLVQGGPAVGIQPQNKQVGALEQEKEKRVAMTLRLDGGRHVKLRVLAALQGRSCQNLLTEALDAYLEDQAAELDPHLWRCLNQDTEASND